MDFYLTASPELSRDYKVVTYFKQNQVVTKQRIDEVKDLLIHSIIISQQNNWILITQMEISYHDRSINEVTSGHLERPGFDSLKKRKLKVRCGRLEEP